MDIKPKMEKCTWIVGAPRSGSMLVFNVTRALLRESGFTVFPEKVPKYPADMLKVADAALVDQNSNNFWVLKLHGRLPETAPKSRFIVTRRDLREALVSFMRFTSCNFEFSLNEIMGAAIDIDHYRSFSQEKALHLEYGLIINDPLTVTTTVHDFLGLNLHKDRINEITSRFDADKVKGIISAAEGYNAYEYRLPNPVGPGISRAYDPTTGFQTGHISNGHDWRVALTPDQQVRVKSLLGSWLTRNGYT